MAIGPRLAVITVAAAAATLAFPAGAGATVHVPRGQVVNDMKVIGDDVRVDGRTRGRVIVIDGNLTVGATGTVADATVIGGRLRTEPGARLRGDVFQFGGSWPQPDSWPALVVLGLLLAFRLLGIWLVLAIAGTIAGRRRLGEISEAARTRPLRTLGVGALAGVGLSAASILLAITLLGLALAAAFWGLLLIGAVTGVALALRAADDGPTVRRLAFVALALPLIGEGLAALAAVTGLGALLRYASELAQQRTSSELLHLR